MNWYKTYGSLSFLLLKFYNECRDKGDDPGKELFEKILYYDENFKNNEWANKLNEEFGFPSLDPIHIFSSISDENITLELRKKRIDILFKSLGGNFTSSKITNDGYPIYNIITLITTRKENEQIEIWNLFVMVVTSGTRINEREFNKFRGWNGVSFQGFTLFLFWICSKFYLPITKEVTLFLKFTEINSNNLKYYRNYKLLLIEIDKYNFTDSNQYGRKGIYREIFYLANQTIGKGKKNIRISSYLNRLLSDVKNDNFGRANGSFSEIRDNIKKPKLENEIDNISEISKLGFKIIAIKALDECSDKIVKNIEKNKHYYFEKCVKVEKNKISYYPELNHDLYSFKSENKSSIKVNITAIVGKNGSGKSSLIELLFGIINNISYSKRISLKTHGLKFISGLSAELIYVNSGYLYKVIINGSDIKIAEYKLNDKLFVQINNLRPFTKSDMDDFFYTIAINYSHYGLNSNLLGNWINGLFHKNDAYQCPIVINPMRTGGNIDINKENELINSRLITNLLSPVVPEQSINVRQLTESQKAVSIDYKLLIDKNIKLFDREDILGKNEEIVLSQLKYNKKELYELIKEVFDFPADFNDSEFPTDIAAKKYIIRKLIRISIKYPIYKVFFDKKNINFFSKESLKNYLIKLKDDESHITFKLKQAINYWKHPNLWPRKKNFSVDIDKDSIKLENYLSNENIGKTIHFLPPPIFSSKIRLNNPSNFADENLLDFDDLSSGEKQIIYAVNSLLYHLKNLDSIANESTLVKYKAINIVLDEIELYYHPEMQQKFVNYLLSMINNFELPTLTAINICLITHSPFILSDIPSSNILKLKNGISQPYNLNDETFAANINDILANDFFLKNGFMGEFVKEKINSLVDFIDTIDNENEQWNIERAKEFIELIGEPLIRTELRELFLKKIQINYSVDIKVIDEEINRLQKIKESKLKKL